MEYYIPVVADMEKLFSTISREMIYQTGGCPCRCTKCNSCACGRCYGVDNVFDVDVLK